jgi:hypothetical protein
VAAVSEPRAIRRTGWLLALAAMTRPEGPLLAAFVIGMAHVFRLIVTDLPARFVVDRWQSIRHELVAVAWFVGVWGPWFAWRYWYYGYLFPNTYYVKAAGAWANPKHGSEMIDHGAHYIWVWLKQTRVVWVMPIAVLGMVGLARSPRFIAGLLCAFLTIIYVPYAISVGGDFMGLHRFIMPMFVTTALAVTFGLEWLSRLAPKAWAYRRYAIPGAAGFVIAAFAATQVELTADSLPCHEVGMWSAHECSATTRIVNQAADHGVIDTPAYLMIYTEDRAKIGRAFDGCFRDDDFSIFGGVGAKPYFSRGRGIDVFGLVSEKIAHDEPRTRPRAGHTKWGSPQLLASYDPTFVFSCYSLDPTFVQHKLAHCAPFWLARGYEIVTMRIGGLRERGEYYTFLAKKSRDFQCPGRLR